MNKFRKSLSLSRFLMLEYFGQPLKATHYMHGCTRHPSDDTAIIHFIVRFQYLFCEKWFNYSKLLIISARAYRDNCTLTDTIERFSLLWRDKIDIGLCLTVSFYSLH